MNEPQRYMKERRKYPRFKSYNLVRLVDAGGRPMQNDPVLVDLSEGGLCFYCEDFLPPNERIGIRISIAEFNCVVNTRARIAWTQRSTKFVGVYFTGVEFVGIEESDRDVLRRLERSSREHGGAAPGGVRVEKLDDAEIDRRGVRSWPIWEKGVSRFDWTYDTGEQCFFLAGRVTVTVGGCETRIGAGDFVTFPPGLSCVWQVHEPVKKHYRFG